MAKSKVTLSIDPYTWEKYKNTYDNASARIQELMEADVDVSKVNDLDLLKDEIRKKEKKLEGLQDEKGRLEKEISKVESDLSTAKATLEKKVQEKEEKSDELSRFEEVYLEKDKFDENKRQFWENETGLEWEELVEKVKS